MQDPAHWTPPPVPGPMTLEGRYVRLVPLSPDHAAALHAANSADDAIWDHLPYGPFAGEAGYADWVAQVAGKPDPRFFAILPAGAADASGVASLMRVDPANGVIEIGHVCLAPSLQRTVAATEVVFLLAEWVFAAGYRRFEWKCDAANARSRRAAARFGFAFEGVFRQAAIVKGRNRDTAWFAMVDRDWPELRAAYRRWFDGAFAGEGGGQVVGLGDLTASTRRRAEAEHPRP